MKNSEFDVLAKEETDRMLKVMCSKSSDYAKDDDKLFNFKQAGRIDGISPIEALRGMWLKHRASIQQGLDELMDGKTRSRDWWIEKLTDDRNYNLLLFALLEETYGDSTSYDKQQPKVKEERKQSALNDSFARLGTLIHEAIEQQHLLDVMWPMIPVGTMMVYNELGEIQPWESDENEEYGGFNIRRQPKTPSNRKSGQAWYISPIGNVEFYLHKDCKLHGSTGWNEGDAYGKSPGYFKSKAHAKEYIKCRRMLKRLGLLEE